MGIKVHQSALLAYRLMMQFLPLILLQQPDFVRLRQALNYAWLWVRDRSRWVLRVSTDDAVVEASNGVAITYRSAEPLCSGL